MPDGSATAKAIDYTLNRWRALTCYLDHGELPVDNNWVENQIRPIAIGRSNWLLAGSLRAGQRAAAVISLLHSARLNGHDPDVYLKDVIERLPTQPASRIDELLPHHWRPVVLAHCGTVNRGSYVHSLRRTCSTSKGGATGSETSNRPSAPCVPKPIKLGPGA